MFVCSNSLSNIRSIPVLFPRTVCLYKYGLVWPLLRLQVDPKRKMNCRNARLVTILVYAETTAPHFYNTAWDDQLRATLSNQERSFSSDIVLNLDLLRSALPISMSCPSIMLPQAPSTTNNHIIHLNRTPHHSSASQYHQ